MAAPIAIAAGLWRAYRAAKFTYEATVYLEKKYDLYKNPRNNLTDPYGVFNDGVVFYY